MDMQNSQSNQDDADVHRKKNELQREMIMQEADQRRKLAEKTRLETEIRALKKEIAHLKVTIQEKQIELGKIDQEIFQMDTEIKGTKKKMNTL